MPSETRAPSALGSIAQAVSRSRPVVGPIRRHVTYWLRTLIATALAVSIVAACSSAPSDSGAKASAAGPGLHARVKATVDEHAKVGVAHLVRATKVWKLTSAKPVDGAVTVRLPLLRRPRANEVVVGLTAEHRSGPWTPVAATVSARGRTVSLSTTHFSWFTGLFTDVGDAISAAKRNVIDGLTSEAFAEAAPPSCANEAQARTGGFAITSVAKDTVYWCFGVEAGQRVLRVVNRRRYPLSVSHLGLTTMTQGHWNGLATLSRIGSGQRAVIAPSEAITFRVDAANGLSSVLHTEFDGFGQALYQLQVGVQTALDLMTAFGFKPATTAIDAAADLASFGDCATALENPSDAGALLAKCFGVKNMIDTFGVKALLIAPLMVASGLSEFFHSEFNALGDQLNRRDEYTIRITSTPPPTTTTTAAAPASFGAFTGEWRTHVGSAVIRGDGTVVLLWFVNDPGTDPPSSGDVEIDLKLVSASGNSAEARVTARKVPPGLDPNAGTGNVLNLQPGDTYTFSLSPPGLVGTGSNADMQWCDDSHNGQCGG